MKLEETWVCEDCGEVFRMVRPVITGWKNFCPICSSENLYSIKERLNKKTCTCADKAKEKVIEWDGIVSIQGVVLIYDFIPYELPPVGSKVIIRLKKDK